MLITVTGATGTIGAELVRILSAAGAPVRAVSRGSRELVSLPGVAWLQADLTEQRLLEPALAGTSRLFLLTDNQRGFGALQIAVLRAAGSLGVEHVVKLSALGASHHSNSWIAREHRQVEDALEATPMSWTMLRPHAFMQNWLGELAESARGRGVVESPIGEGRVPFIDTRDIAAVAVEALLHPESHAGKKYFLTGREAVGYGDLAAVLAEETGRSIRYDPIAMDEARRRLEAQGMHADQIDALLAIAAYQKEGGPTAKVSDHVAKILGRPPRTIREFVRDHRSAFGAD